MFYKYVTTLNLIYWLPFIHYFMHHLRGNVSVVNILPLTTYAEPKIAVTLLHNTLIS